MQYRYLVGGSNYYCQQRNIDVHGHLSKLLREGGIRIADLIHHFHQHVSSAS